VVTVAFFVELAFMIGAIRLASGPEEAPEFVTAWQMPLAMPVQEPLLDDPRGLSETFGSVALAAEVTLPVQVDAPWQSSTAPEVDAADGPAASLAGLVVWPGPASASAAPGPVAAVDTDRAWQPPVPPEHDAEPADERGTVAVAVRPS
jgi:hypothetical protein